jgi:hypothetical protein
VDGAVWSRMTYKNDENHNLKGSYQIQGFQLIKTTKENRRKMKGLRRNTFSGFQGGYCVNYGRLLGFCTMSSFSSLSYDRSKASSKVSSLHSAI